MKNVLFISITKYEKGESTQHLEKKFEGLSKGINVFVIGRGKSFPKYIWGCYFYLIRSRFIYLPAAIVLGSYLCLTKKVDTIVCQGPLTEGIVGAFLKIVFRKELIIEIHGDWRKVPFLTRNRLPFPLLRKIVPRLGMWTLGQADKIRTITFISQGEIRPHFPNKKYFVFPAFTDIDVFLGEKNVSFKNYVAAIAVLSPIKNIETLIGAFSRIHKQFPNFKLVIGGDGPSKKSLELLAYSSGLSGNVIFTGKLSLNEVREVMRDCYAFALPSLNEGFGRVFIEAMALGKPVIAPRVGGVSEVVRDGENGFLIEPKDVDALFLKLAYLIDNPDHAIRMGEAGQRFVRKNFSNEKYIKNYIDMINA